MRKKVLPLSGPIMGVANDPLGPLGSAGPGVALRTKKKKITSLSFGVSIVYFKVYGRYQFQFNKIGGPQDTHVKPGGPVKQNRNYLKQYILQFSKNILVTLTVIYYETLINITIS